MRHPLFALLFCLFLASRAAVAAPPASNGSWLALDDRIAESGAVEPAGGVPRMVRLDAFAGLAGAEWSREAASGAVQLNLADGRTVAFALDETRPSAGAGLAPGDDRDLLVPVGLLALRCGYGLETLAEGLCTRLLATPGAASAEDFLSAHRWRFLARTVLDDLRAERTSRALLAVDDYLFDDAFPLLVGAHAFVPLRPAVAELGGTVLGGPGEWGVRSLAGETRTDPAAPVLTQGQWSISTSLPILEYQGEPYAEAAFLAERFGAESALEGDETAIARIRTWQTPKTAADLVAEMHNPQALFRKLDRLNGQMHKVAYLTFDDGPSRCTPEILEILDRYDVQATFFVLGTSVESDPETVKRIVDAGHAVGNHSYSHVRKKVYASPAAFLAEVERANDLIEAAAGVRPKLVRPPYGSYGNMNAAFFDLMREHGYRIVDWNLDSRDSMSLSVKAERIVSEVEKQAAGKTELVLLFHDSATKAETVRALPRVVEFLRAEGFELRPLRDNTRIRTHGVVK